MTRPIRNTGPCFPSGLPRRRGQRDVLSHTEFINAHILHALSLPGHPLRVTEKATHGEQVGLYSLHSRMGTSITVNIVPKCEVCPRDHGKVVESLRGEIEMIVEDPINLSLVDNEKKDTNSIREINEFETKNYSIFF